MGGVWGGVGGEGGWGVKVRSRNEVKCNIKYAAQGSGA